MDFPDLLQEKIRQGILSPEVAKDSRSLMESFRIQIAEQGHPVNAFDSIVIALLEGTCQHLKTPFIFDHFHKRSREPVDYFQIGLDFVKHMIDWKRSHVHGWEQVEKILQQLEAGENVILFGNHQAEVDPQIVSALLMERAPRIAQEIIFVAGHRVTTDPVAVPFSAGRNLLCIHSKRHIDHPPEEKEAKQRHNQRTMRAMSDLLAQGGACIYVAPSGGRDRKNSQGNVEIAPLDPQAIEMFLLMAKKAKTPTHFYPLSLMTYHLMPPPAVVRKEAGEARVVNFTGVQIAFAAELEPESFPGAELKDKKARRQARADHLYSIIAGAHERHTGCN